MARTGLRLAFLRRDKLPEETVDEVVEPRETVIEAKPEPQPAPPPAVEEEEQPSRVPWKCPEEGCDAVMLIEANIRIHERMHGR